jgi:hypothetical protein
VIFPVDYGHEVKAVAKRGMILRFGREAVPSPNGLIVTHGNEGDIIPIRVSITKPRALVVKPPVAPKDPASHFEMGNSITSRAPALKYPAWRYLMIAWRVDK